VAEGVVAAVEVSQAGQGGGALGHLDLLQLDDEDAVGADRVGGDDAAVEVDQGAGQRRAPVARVGGQRAKRSLIVTSRLANRADTSCWAALSTFTHSTPLPAKKRWAKDERFMHTSTVGGLSVTLQTAEAVKPAGPSGPSVVMTVTAPGSRAMPLRNSPTETGEETEGALASMEAPGVGFRGPAPGGPSANASSTP
jgi:hypothetical protein